MVGLMRRYVEASPCRTSEGAVDAGEVDCGENHADSPPAIFEIMRDCFYLFGGGESGGAGEVRTPDKRFRKPLLYPSELQPRSSLL
jgi:hypothetical protein